MTRERPILFSGPVVLAILEGRKTQTRRVVNNMLPEVHGGYFDAYNKEEFWNWWTKDHRPSLPQVKRPSIHMPRWASRITLEVVSVRVEQLQDISREDAAAEGVCIANEADRFKGYATHRWPEQNFETLWNLINGPGSWDANPWVWVVEFKRVRP